MIAPARVTTPRTSVPALSRGGCVLLLAFGCVSAGSAQMNAVEENSVKAAFTYNFAKFVEWPAELWTQAAKMRVCLAGGSGDAFAQALNGLAAKPPVQGKEIQVVQLARRDEVRSCHMLVVADEGPGGDAWLAAAQGLPVLTVSDRPQFIDRGGMIGLLVEGDRVRFEANIEPAQRGNLKLSSQLLKLARTVKGAPGAKP